MRLLVVVISLLCSAALAAASVEPLDYSRVNALDLVLDLSTKNGDIAGAVVVVGARGKIHAVRSRGLVAPGGAPLDDAVVFDLASLTKVVATAPAVMKLAETGRLSLTDPLGKWFAEFRGKPREQVTITHLLTHTSGLTDFDLRPGQDAAAAVAQAASGKGRLAPGTFNYADINFIILGELVRRVSGKPLDAFCRDEFYVPLGMKQTGFGAPARATVAPTPGSPPGLVQDLNARRLGGVAGHAGLFSSGADLARFCRMMLAGGELDGTRVLAEASVRQMTAPVGCGGATLRGLGWDIQSHYSAPKGRLCTPSSYGHSGYSGTSLWIDPAQDLFAVILSNRLDYRGTLHALRSDVATVAAAQYGKPEVQAARVELAPARLPVAQLHEPAPKKQAGKPGRVKKGKREAKSGAAKSNAAKGAKKGKQGAKGKKRPN